MRETEKERERQRDKRRYRERDTETVSFFSPVDVDLLPKLLPIPVTKFKSIASSVNTSRHTHPAIWNQSLILCTRVKVTV